MKSLTTILILCIACVPALSQGWLPSVAIDAKYLWPSVVHDTSRNVLIPMSNLMDGEVGSVEFFDVENLSSEQDPSVFPPGFVLSRLLGVFDANGNGVSDLIATPEEPTARWIFDAFSPNHDTRDDIAVIGAPPRTQTTNRVQIDVDGDGYVDAVSAQRFESFARISYGDSADPWYDGSIVPVPKLQSHFEESQVVAIGMLADVPAMVQLVFKSTGFDDGYYQLVRLDAEDLRKRRDTVSTTLIAEVQNPDMWLFDKIILQSDSVWHVYHQGVAPAGTVSLRILPDDIEILPANNLFTLGRQENWFGQGKVSSNNSYPIVINASKPFLVYHGKLREPVVRSSVLMARCTDAYAARVDTIGIALLPEERDAGGVGSAMVIPDQDGDGVEEAMIHHFWTDPASGESRHAVSMFLTTEIKPVSVQEKRQIQGDLPPCAFTNAPAYIYNVLGEVVAEVEIVDDQVAPHQLETLPQQPLWVVQGECVRRLR